VPQLAENPSERIQAVLKTQLLGDLP